MCDAPLRVFRCDDDSDICCLSGKPRVASISSLNLPNPPRSSIGGTPSPHFQAVPRWRFSGARPRATAARCNPCCGFVGEVFLWGAMKKCAAVSDGSVVCASRRGDGGWFCWRIAVNTTRGDRDANQNGRRWSNTHTHNARHRRGRRGVLKSIHAAAVANKAAPARREFRGSAGAYLHDGDEDSWSPPGGPLFSLRAPNISPNPSVLLHPTDNAGHAPVASRTVTTRRWMKRFLLRAR